MKRSVPLWFFLLISLAGIIAAVLFAWLVKTTAFGEARTGAAGSTAMRIASFPDTVQTSLRELRLILSGERDDHSMRVRREPDISLDGFAPVVSANGVQAPGLLMRAERARLRPGWRLLAGAFELNGAVTNAIVLLSPELELARVIPLDEPVEGDPLPRPPSRKLVHGVKMLPDGSVIFAFDGGATLQRFDACGKRLWSTPGHYHHAVETNPDGSAVWTFLNDDLALIDLASGEQQRRITVDQIMSANPGLGVLDLRLKRADNININSRNDGGRWLDDPWHFNDIDPLPAGLADRFPQFAAGDLLISSRSLNLVFVLDPESLAIKWWRIGAARRQHDPDWERDGTISILSNRMGQDTSEIVVIDPRTNDRRVRLDGRNMNFYTRIRGKHQTLPDGTMLIASSQQGRAFEIDRDGQMVLELINIRPGDDAEAFNYIVTELSWLPPDFFSPEVPTCQKAP